MASGSVTWLDEQYMSTVSLLVNILYVTVIVGIVAASMVTIVWCKCWSYCAQILLLECYQAWLAFFLSHLTETVSFQHLASLCGCGINIVSSFGSLGHSKVVKVITYLCGCQVDWSQTICFLCIMHGLGGLMDGQS